MVLYYCLWGIVITFLFRSSNMNQVEKQVLVETTVKSLTPEGASPLPEQVKTAKHYVGLAITALSDETKGKILEAKNSKAEGAMTPEHFRRLSEIWKAEDLAMLMGLKRASIYLYRRGGKYAVKSIPPKTAAKLIALRKEYNRSHNVKTDPILDSVLQAMGLK